MSDRRDFLVAAAWPPSPWPPGEVKAEALPPVARKRSQNTISASRSAASAHDHIHGMIGAIQRGGGELVAAWGAEPDKLAAFRQRHPEVKIAASQDEIILHSDVQLILSSHIANERAGIGVKSHEGGARISWPTSPASPPSMTWRRCEGPSRKPGASTPSCTASGWR